MFAFSLLKRIINKLGMFIRIIFWKIEYGKRIKICFSDSFRKGISINISPHGRIEIGQNVFLNNQCSLNAHHLIKIGDNSILGEGVKIYDHNHRYNSGDLIIRQGFKEKPVIVGKNCWLGSNVIILAGTQIGDNSVIGAGCVIRENIPNNVVVKPNQSYVKELIKYEEKNS